MRPISLPLPSHSAPPLLVLLLEVRGEIYHEEIRVTHGAILQWRSHDIKSAYDRQTDERTDDVYRLHGRKRVQTCEKSILQGSAVTQTVLCRLTIYRPDGNFLECTCQKLWKMVGGKQNYCGNKRLIFGPPCISALSEIKAGRRRHSVVFPFDSHVRSVSGVRKYSTYAPSFTFPQGCQIKRQQRALAQSNISD